MLKRNLVLKFSSLMLATSMMAGAPAIIHAAQGTTSKTAASQTIATNAWRPARPTAGMGSFVLTNYFGQGGQLTVDLDRGHYVTEKVNDKIAQVFIVDEQNHYIVSEDANGMPGRLQVNLAPGTYRYTASVPDVATINGSLDLAPGHITGLGFYGGLADQVPHESDSRNDNYQHTSTKYDITKVLLAQQDMTAQAH